MRSHWPRAQPQGHGYVRRVRESADARLRHPRRASLVRFFDEAYEKKLIQRKSSVEFLKHEGRPGRNKTEHEVPKKRTPRSASAGGGRRTVRPPPERATARGGGAPTPRASAARDARGGKAVRPRRASARAARWGGAPRPSKDGLTLLNGARPAPVANGVNPPPSASPVARAAIHQAARVTAVLAHPAYGREVDRRGGGRLAQIAVLVGS
jgi:hypothetical protein